MNIDTCEYELKFVFAGYGNRYPLLSDFLMHSEVFEKKQYFRIIKFKMHFYCTKRFESKSHNAL